MSLSRCIGLEQQIARARQRGFSLVEAIVFIVLVSVAIGGVMMAVTAATRDSVDPLIRKQALTIAEALLEEIRAMPFTFCDPDDPAVSTATSAAGCATPEAMGPEPGETRYAPGTPFDNVNDYHLYDTATEVPPGVKDITGAPIAGIGSYNAAVNITQVALGVVPAAESLQIAVTVTGPSNTVVTLEGYRTRYAPSAAP